MQLIRIRACVVAIMLVLSPTLVRLPNCLINSRSYADEKLKDIACRSVHLGFPGEESLAFYNEVTIRTSAAGTYFMVCGWDAGYFGLQELGNGKKLVLFSVWDNHKGDDPTAVDEEVRVKMLHKDEAVRVGRFGGEGTGGQSFFDYDWKVDETYRLMVTCSPNGNRTEYTGFFFVPESKSWKKLVTFSTITSGKRMRGFYSFVEDFKRDRESTKHTRRADFGNGFTMDQQKKWHPITTARFTADANPVVNIDAGPTADRFFLATGGELQNKGTKLRESMKLAADQRTDPPADVVELVK